MPRLSVLAAFALAAAITAVTARADDYQPRNTQAPGEEPPTPEEAAAAIRVPEGFQVRLFAGEPDVRQPVAMALDDRGRLWVAESYSYKEWQQTGEDRVLIFEDTDNDGRHDKRTIFASGFNHLSGMTVGWGGVWVCSAPHLLFIPDADRDDVPDGEPQVVLDGWTTEAKHNFFNGLTWGIDGWLYGRHGITAPSKVGKPGTPDDERPEFDCSIWRYHPVTEAFEVVCRGTTNPWGLDWNAAGDMFFTNNVNGHLWHAIPGAYYPRMGNRADPFARFVYDRIPMCCDHLHHAGGTEDWTKTRDGVGVHGELGGGHSHCGGMIYLGGKWPEKYRDRMFMCNTHGRRVNVDRLDPEGATYVGRHEDDFLHADNPWFRGVQLLYGPDGDVYLSDWCDLGECHDNDGVHRTSGRIYKIIYGEPSPPMEETLWEMSDEELDALHKHENEWYARMARWILWYRARNDEPVDVKTLWEPEWLQSSDDAAFVRYRLSAPDPTADDDEVWRRIGFVIGNPLTAESETLQLLTYYKIKDLAAAHPDRSRQVLQAAGDSCLLFTKNLAQNLSENAVFDPLIELLESSANEGLSDTLFTGLTAGLEGRRGLPTPERWPDVFDLYYDHPDFRAAALRVQQVFDERDCRERLLTLLDSEATADRKLALDLLGEMPLSGLEPTLLELIENPDLAPTAIAVLARSGKAEIAEQLIDRFSSLPAPAQLEAIDLLCSRAPFAEKLLDAIEAGALPRQAVTAYHAQQIGSLDKGALKPRLHEVWGQTRSSSEDQRAEIKRWQDQLTADVLAEGDLANGKAKFDQLCAACHQLHGAGGEIGPELTGANRADLYYLLENIIAPSTTLPQDYRMTVVTRKDGSVLSGNITSRNEYALTLRTLTDSTTINTDDIDKVERLDVSMMPEGLLAPLSDDDVRDLIAFLQKP